MFNQVMIVGKIVSPIEEIELENNKMESKISVEIDNYDKSTTNISCILRGNISEKAKLYLKAGDLIAMRGRLNINIIDGKQVIDLDINAISFVSSKKLEKNLHEVER